MRAQVVQLARECGFDACRFTTGAVAAHRANYFGCLEHGLHADMDWLARSPERRSDPRIVLPECKSVIVLACNYYQGNQVRQQPGRFARYAFGIDYHDILLDRMKPIAAFLEKQGGTQRCYVDTGPVLERDFAGSAGIGCLATRRLGLAAALGFLCGLGW